MLELTRDLHNSKVVGELENEVMAAEEELEANEEEALAEVIAEEAAEEAEGTSSFVVCYRSYDREESMLTIRQPVEEEPEPQEEPVEEEPEPQERL